MNKELDALVNVVKAWEKLPEGRYSTSEIQKWLIGPMHKAIVNARKVIEERKSNE